MEHRLETEAKLSKLKHSNVSSLDWKLSTLGTHLGNKLPVLLVQVGRRSHIILPDTDLALFCRSGKNQNHITASRSNQKDSVGEFQHFLSAERLI